MQKEGLFKFVRNPNRVLCLMVMTASFIA